MKLLSLLTILALHLTGLWGQLPGTTQSTLVTQAAGPTSSADPATPAALPALPLKTADTPSPNITAASAVVIDRDTATVLYAENPATQRPIASVTKLATAFTILSRHQPDERVTIPKLPDYPVEAETAGLVTGDTFTIHDLLELALVPSDNDAADALALIDAGSIPAFTDRVNAKLAEWGITGVHFASASGLEDQNNYATAAALAKLASVELHNSAFAAIVKMTSVTVTGGQGRVYRLKSTNDLLASGNFYGIKTGYTQAAGECFVGLTRINGHEVITVVLGSDDRFGDTTTLINWSGHAWQWL